MEDVVNNGENSGVQIEKKICTTNICSGTLRHGDSRIGYAALVDPEGTIQSRPDIIPGQQVEKLPA